MVREDCWSSSAGCSPERSSPSCSRSDDRRLVHVLDDRRRGQPVVIPTSLAVAPRESSQRATRSRWGKESSALLGGAVPVLHAHSCAVRPVPSHPRSRHPPTGDHPAGTELGRSLQDRQKPAHLSSVSKINYVRIAADCLDRELSGRSPQAIWTPHANRRPSVSSSTPAKNTPLRCAILSDAFPRLLPLVIGQTRVRDFN